ncbi:MAG: tetratricopeptide repeat protein [Bacteroidales bacterium]|nr:tetratricopeptide repeat protein [Bacteroidales bacterium]
MKKIFLALALIVTAQFAFAQKPDAIKKDLEKAEAAAQNPKKAEKAATWLKLAEVYLKAYEAPAGNIWVGATQQDMALVMKENPISQEQVETLGVPYLKLVYSNKNVYLNEGGQIAAIEVTEPLVEGALEKATEAYKKAFSLEPKKSQEIEVALQGIAQKYCNEASSLYTLGQFANASKDFEKSADVYATAPLSMVDTNSVYNAALCAMAVPDYDRAEKFYKKCYDLGYYSESGDVFSRLADIRMHAGDTVKAASYLEEGFTKFPQSQGILIGLINYYIGKGDGTDRLFELIGKAKENEPNNASLYYVEGNIYNQLGDFDKAVAAYDECSKINPDYEYGFIGKGIMYYNRAVDIQNKANEEYDDAKYNALVKEFEAALKGCIEPFMKAFEVTKDESIKPTIAEYLKNAFFRFREESPENQANYEKFEKIARGE